MGKAILVGLQSLDFKNDDGQAIQGKKLNFLTKDRNFKGWDCSTYYVGDDILKEILRDCGLKKIEMYTLWDLSINKKGKFADMEYISGYGNIYPPDHFFTDSDNKRVFLNLSHTFLGEVDENKEDSYSTGED